MDFLDKSGAYFYNLIKSGKVNWYLFNLNLIKLSRFDIHYLRKESKIDEDISVYEFLQRCEKKIIKHSRIVVLSCIIRIGSFKSLRFYRVYEKKTGLEFEIELKKEAIVYFGRSLFSSQLADLEDILLKEFYKYFRSLLVLNISYIDWLVL